MCVYEALWQYCPTVYHKGNDKICPPPVNQHTHSMGAFLHMHTLFNQHNNISMAHPNTVQVVIF